jgi:hypothetical protein
MAYRLSTNEAPAAQRELEGLAASLTFTSWNQIALWLRQLDNLRSAA